MFAGWRGKKGKQTNGTGRDGEELAAGYLKKKGYQIVERNFRLRTGEIDIVARDGECLVFVEVKTRKNNRFGSPFDAVDERKQRQLARAALAYMAQHRCMEVEVRFDVIAVFIEQGKVRVEQIQNAFEYNG